MSSSTSSISEPAPAASPAEPRRFAGESLAGVIRAGLQVELDELRRVVDPAAAEKTVHWGRNYLYSARLRVGGGADAAGRGDDLAVVVKMFRERGARRRLQRRRKGTKARRSFDAATALLAAGVPTPRPVAAIESTEPSGASFFLYEQLEEALEARYFFRALNSGRAGEEFPSIDGARLLEGIASTLRRMHEARLWHRDVSAGNLLLAGDWSAGASARGTRQGSGELYLIDLARLRIGRTLTRSERLRDLARLPLHRSADRDALLRNYYQRAPSAVERGWFALHHHAFHLRHRLKDRLRGVRQAARGLRSRGTHAHIPPAPAGAAVRDRVVWDPLSDQPHLHAGRASKLKARLADAGIHGREAAVLLRRLPAIASRYWTLRGELYGAPVAFGEAGVGLHGGSAPGPELVAAVDGLGLRRVLLRIQPWENELERDAQLARELHARGRDVVLAVAQNRDLVRDPQRWRDSLREIAERFDGVVTHVQIGLAINRSKWGIWNQREYAELVSAAADVFGAAQAAQRGPAVGRRRFQIVGPGVIDFELYATCIALDWPEIAVPFDAVTSLLYVDRRGAPENHQAGLDAVAKAMLLRATIETSRHGARESWITEVNWPLHEGPHSPAGRHVAVSEEAQASYLARYYLLLLGSGLVERVYWWQLVARGYGLAERDGDGLRRRPSWHALAFLERTLAGSRARGPLPSTVPLRVHAFDAKDGGGWLVAWSAADRVVEWKLPATPRRLFDRDGRAMSVPAAGTLRVDGSPVYAELAEPVSASITRAAFVG